MQCPQCGFENLPKNTACTRCRAQLVVDGPVVKTDFEPPRARDWKFLRPLQYRIFALQDRLPADLARFRRIFNNEDVLPTDAWAALFCSVIPGLGHLIVGQRRAATVVFCGWILLLVLGVLLFGSTAGHVFLGLLMSGHAVAAAHASGMRSHIASLRGRLTLILMLLFVTASVYGGLYAFALRSYDLATAAVDYADLGISTGDQVLVRRGVQTWARGDVAVASETNRWVTLRPDNGTNGVAAVLQMQGDVLLRVIALPGERVQVGPQGVAIEGVDASLLQSWTRGALLSRKPMEIVVSPNHIIAIGPATVPDNEAYAAYDFGLILWNQFYLRPVDSVSGRGIAVYFPLLRRHWFNTDRPTDVPAP
jgi:hypothetical protein